MLNRNCDLLSSRQSCAHSDALHLSTYSALDNGSTAAIGTPASSADGSGGVAPITSYGRCLRRVKVQVSRIRCNEAACSSTVPHGQLSLRGATVRTASWYWAS